ncbi:MAG TPA: GNAT family N-acetyltransferase [Geminicoccaceae bacterium]|nr:GNAT family N-acetyltransferase [Geminicoccaceae bacterium]
MRPCPTVVVANDSAGPLIRPARPADVPAIAAVQRASILGLCVGAYGREGAAAWADASAEHAPTMLDGGTFLVAEEAGGAVVAVAGWSPHEERPHGAWIRSLFVHPERAGRGLGRRLMAVVEESARASGRTAFAVRASLNAVGFYKAVGYSEVERQIWSDRHGGEFTAVLMVKPTPPHGDRGSTPGPGGG